MIPIIECRNCGDTTDYRVTPNGPHNEAICNACKSHIKFLSKMDAVRYYLSANQKPATAQATATKSTTMANGLWGSICIEDIFNGQVMQGQDGRNYVCLDNLLQEPFQKSDKNGKHYAKVQVWINDEPDQYQNVASMSLSQSQAQRDAGQNRVYIGNLKWNQQQQQPAPLQQPAPPQYGHPQFHGGAAPVGYGASQPAYPGTHVAGAIPGQAPQYAQPGPQVNGGAPVYNNDLPF